MPPRSAHGIRIISHGIRGIDADEEAAAGQDLSILLTLT